jgi:LacI family transcriptional regulator
LTVRKNPDKLKYNKWICEMRRHIVMDQLTQPKRNRLQSRGIGSPTLKDVATRAGVSTATVSRVLNTPGAVRQALREKVRQAIHELGYVPHGAARALASQRTHTIGAVIPTIDNAIFARGVQALQRRLRESGYTLLLATSEYDIDREREQAETLVMRGVDGMLLVGQTHAPEVHELLLDKDIPYVQTWVFDESSDHPCVGFDNREAARRIATYLLEIGHRDIGMIVPVTTHNDRATERILGVRDALSAYDCELPADRLLECPISFPQARARQRALMTPEPRPTAVICGNDVLAFGALMESRALGIEVPGDVSITGFADLDFAAHLDPALTTMRIPSEEMGRCAADYLLSRLSGESVPSNMEFEASLIVRGTTGPPGDRPRSRTVRRRHV